MGMGGMGMMPGMAGGMLGGMQQVGAYPGMMQMAGMQQGMQAGVMQAYPGMISLLLRAGRMT